MHRPALPNTLILAINPRNMTLMAPGEAWTIAALATTPLPHRSVTEGVVDAPARLGGAIRTLHRRLGCRARSVAVLLSPEWYSMRVLRLPDIPQAEQRQVVRGELEQGGAIPYGGGAFDFVWMPPQHGHEVAFADVYAYHMTEQAAAGLREAVDEAGLRLVSFHPASLSTLRSAVSGRLGQEPVAFLIPEPRYADLAIYADGALRQLRRIPVGYATLFEVEEHADRRSPLGFLQPEEEARRRSEAQVTIPTAIWSDEDETVEAVAQETIPVEDRGESLTPPPPIYGPREQNELVQEIERTLSFYAREHPSSDQPRLLAVIGAARQVAHVHGALSGGLSLPIAAVDLQSEVPLSGPAAESAREVEPASVIGGYGVLLSLLGDGRGIPALDVGRQDVRRKVRSSRTIRRWLFTGLAAGALSLVAVVGFAAAVGLARQEAESELKRIRSEIALLEVQRAPILRQRAIRDAALKMHREGEAPAGAVLGRVAAAANSGMRLSHLDLSSQGPLRLSGEAINTRSIQQFAIDLGAGAAIRLPVPTTVRRQDRGPFVQFSISAVAGPERPKASDASSTRGG